MSWQGTVSAVGDAVTSGAVLVAGGWGYFRFVRGRIFAPRAEIAVAAAPMKLPLSGLRVQVALKNTGTSQLRLSDIRFLETFALAENDWPERSNVDWGEPLISSRVLLDHDWLESSETVNEDVLVPLPSTNSDGIRYIAFLVRAHVSAPTSRSRRAPTGWTAHAVVLIDDVANQHPVDAQIPS